jgi:hypothetical protein
VTAQSSSGQLDGLIQSALQNTGSNTTIVIINRTPALVPKLDSIVSQTAQQTQTGKPCTNSTAGDSQTLPYMTLDDISGLVDITRSIGELYDGYYKIFPDQKEVVGDSNTSILDKTAQILSFYGKVRNFVVAIIDEFGTIQKDVAVIRARVNTLQTSQMDMFRFLGLDKRYAQVKLRTAAYEGFDPKFGAYYMDMIDVTVNFQVNVQTVLRTVADLESYTMMFLSAVQELSNIGINKYNNQFLNIVDKVDTVLMFLATLVQLKVELEAGVQNTIVALKTLGTQRKSLSTTLVNLENLAQFYELKGGVSNSMLTINGIPSLRPLLCIGLPLLFWFK